MILSFINCLDNYQDPAGRIRRYFWARADTILRALRGEKIAVDYELFASNGFEVKEQPSDLRGENIEAFFWTSFADSKSHFYDVGGVPVVPYIDPEIIPFENITPADSERKEAFLSDHSFQRLPQMSVEELVPIWKAVDDELRAVNPRMRKALVFYDIARLLPQAEYAARFGMLTCAMMQVLGARGWEIHNLPFNAPGVGD